MNPDLRESYAVQEAWLAKLGEWDEALIKYDRRLTACPEDGEAIAGKLKCLDALGRWEDAIALCNESLDHLRVDNTRGASPPILHQSSQDTILEKDGNNVDSKESKVHTKAAIVGARAAWSLNQWGLMGSFVSQLPSNNVDACFMRAVLAVHQENYKDSATYIEQTRRYLDSSLSALLSESYGRAYMSLIMIQQCAELEEITEYKVLLREAGLADTDSFPCIDGNDSVRSLGSWGSGMNYQSVPKSGRKGKPAIRLSDCCQPSSSSSSTSTYYGGLSGCEDGDAGGGAAIEQSPLWLAQEEAKQRKSLLVEKWRTRIRGCSSTGRAAIPVWKVITLVKNLLSENSY